ncbi:MAG TPA: hypothetical protein ENL21_08515, partial [Caldithrix abyssi]|nr:hypothetical protein [Caldithrix abyssi]
SLQAHGWYIKARDYDAIPFRAPSQINEIIEQKAHKFKVNLVDMKTAFATKSRFGIPGQNLFSDHLHPNPVGYRLMANAFFTALTKGGLPAKLANPLKLNSRPLFVTDLDWEIGAVRIFKLKHSWPFSTRAVDYSKYTPMFDRFTADLAMNFLFKNTPWGRVHSQMAEHYEKQGNLPKACAEYQAIIAMYPQKVTYHEKLIRCAKKLKDWSLVKWACQKALPYTQAKGMFYYHLAMAEWMTGQRKEALKHIDLASRAPELTREQLTNIFFTYARLLIQVKQVKTAREVLQALVQEVPEFTPAQKLLQKLNRSF